MVCIRTIDLPCLSRRVTARTTGQLRSWSQDFGSIATAINIIATILCMRCPGMKLSRMPLLAWLNLGDVREWFCSR